MTVVFFSSGMHSLKAAAYGVTMLYVTSTQPTQVMGRLWLPRVTGSGPQKATSDGLFMF